MKRRLIFILTGFIVLGIAAFFYIDTIFLPIQFKRFITTRAERLLQREVSIGAIDFRPIKGFIIENITIARKDAPNKPFIQIRQVTFNLLLAPIFRKKAVIIPNIKIEDPFVYLSRDKNRIWNFSDLPNLGKKVKEKNAFPVLLRKLTLKGGKIHYEDKTLEEEFFESIENIAIDTTLSLNSGIRFIIGAQVPKHKTALKIKGNYNLLAKKLTSQVLLDNIHLARYLPLAYASQPHIRLADGMISSADFGVTYEGRELRVQGACVANNTDLRVGENKQITGTVHVPDMLLTWRDKKWDAKGHIQIPFAYVTTGENREFRGDIAADLNLLTVFGNNMTSQGDVTIDNAHLKIGENNHLKGNITATNASLAKQAGNIRLQGNFNIEKTRVTIGTRASLKGNLSTMETKLTWPPDGEGNHKLNAQSGLKMSGIRMNIGEDKTVSGDISMHKISLVYDRKKITVEADGQINTTDILLTANRRFQGNPYFNVFYQYDPENKNPVDYKGIVHLTKSLLTGIPYLEKIDNIEGTATITPDLIQTDGLTFNAQETNIKLSGLLTNFAKPALDIRASSQDIKLQKILTLFPALREKIKIDLTGKAAVEASYKGPIAAPSKATIELATQLADTTVTHKNLHHDITDISGKLNYKTDLITWDNLHGDYQEKTYVLNGQLSDFSRPVIDSTVTADQLNLTAQVKLLHSAFRLTGLEGDYLNSYFNLKGDVHLFEDADADIDLRGKIALDLRDIGALVPRLKDRTKQFNPIGVLTGEGIYMGKLKDWRNWQLAFDAQSSKIMLKGYPFQDVAIRFAQRDLAISKCDISSKIYGGELEIISSADLRGEEIPFSSTISLKNLELSKFREDKKPKDRQLTGILALSTNLEGTVDEWRELTGEGFLSITDGYLWQWNILEGISAVLLIPEFKNFVFTEAYGDFVIQDQRISTNNAQMKSKSVGLDGEGWIDFHQNLNFDITPTFSEIAILRSGSLKKGPTSILTQTKGYLNIRLTGTLDNPQHHIEKFPLRILEETIGETTNTLKEVIGGIVDEIF